MSAILTPSVSTVALVDTRWGGHHLTYLREFTASLLRLGARVHLICYDPARIVASLPPELACAAAERVFCQVFVHRNQGVLRRKRDHDPLSTLARWRATGRAVRRIEARSGYRTDLVFFPYLDSYLRFAPFPSLPKWLLGRPWSGLYLRNGHLDPEHFLDIPWWKRAAKGDSLMKAPDCRAIYVLDERFNENLCNMVGHPVIAFPDMTDETPPDDSSELAAEIQQRAGGRKIIGLISIEKRKGILTLLKTAQLAKDSGKPWFFVATGPFAQETFSAEELSFCEEMARQAADGRVDNLYLDLTGNFFPDGKPYNSLFTSFDIVWAAYEDFEGSSNALTKAAAFRIPLVATEGQCIGGRVERYQLGRTIPQGNATAAVVAISGIIAGQTADGHPLTPAFEKYHYLHSRTRLDDIFHSLLAWKDEPGFPKMSQAAELGIETPPKG
jgi:glycosyltransferase involved in cell wall biosynthesis